MTQFQNMLHQWTNGTIVAEDKVKDKPYRGTRMTRRRLMNVSKHHLKNAQILVEGAPIDEGWDVYSDEGRKNMTEAHVYWVQTYDGMQVACFHDGGLKELSLAMCQSIWPNIHTKNVGENRRVLSTGVTIPVIPIKFYEYKKHNQLKSKESRTRKKQKTNKPIQHITFSIKDRPSMEQIETSVIYPTPGFLTSSCTLQTPLSGENGSISNNTKKKTVRGQYRKDLLWDILSQARDVAYQIPEHRAELENDDEFTNIKSMDDLMQYQHSKQLLKMFNYFF